MRNGMMVFMVLAITACGGLRAQSDREKFDALCEQEAGLHVYRTVKADEIFSEEDGCGSLCPIVLVDSKAINRIGFCADKPFGPWKARQPPGCYVYEKGLRGDPACFAALEGGFQVIENKTFFESQCIKLMTMKEKSRYRSRASLDVLVVDKEISSAILKSSYEIYDSEDDQLLMSWNYLTFTPKNYRSGVENHYMECKNFDPLPALNAQSQLLDSVFR